MKHQCETCNYLVSTTKVCPHCSRRTCRKCMQRCHGMVLRRNKSGVVHYTCSPPGQQDIFQRESIPERNVYDAALPDDVVDEITYRVKESKYHDNPGENPDDRRRVHD